MKDLMGTVGPKTNEIIGFIRVTVFEAKNIAILDEKTKTSDPYCKLYFDGWKEKKTTQVIEKNLNPVWNRQYHSWIFDPKQTELRIEVWDEDTIRDDFAGLITINVPLQDTVIDQWFDLKGREGKKDKHVQGSIHVKIEVGMTKRNVATSIWTKPSFIMVDPDTGAFMLEIQGDVDEELMNIIVAGIVLPAPQRFYNKDGSPSSWRISVPVRPAGGKLSDDHTEQKRLTDRMQNYMITLWNRLRELGWFYVCKNGDNLLFLNFPSNAPWFAPPPFAMKPVAYPGYITVDQRPTLSQLEIQGEIDEAIVREAAGSHKVERIDDKDGTFLRWRICVSIGIVSIFAQRPSRRESQRFQLALLEILQVLGRHGYIYISDYYLPGWGEHMELSHRNEDQYHSFYYSRQDVREKTHILYRDVSTFYYATSVCPPTYLLVDPRPFDWKVSIQGPLDLKMFKEFNPGFPEPKDYQDKDGAHLSWQWKVRNAEKMTWTEKQWKRVENRFQNYILNVYDAVSRMGFRFVIDIGKTALFVIQGPPEPTTAHLTVDLGWFEKKPIMEFQGTIDGPLLNEIGSVTGLNAAKQILDSDGTHLCYSSPIPYDKEGTFSSYEERKRVQNQFQCYVLNAFDLLSKVGFSYVTAQKNTHIFQKREIPTPIPLVSWLLVDPSYIKGRGSVVEIQGQIDPVVLAKIGEALHNPGEPLTNSKTGSSFGWVFVVPDTSSFAWTTTTYKRQENMQQNYSLKILNMLYSFGWFPVDKVDTSAGIFLTRNLS